MTDPLALTCLEPQDSDRDFLAAYQADRARIHAMFANAAQRFMLAADAHESFEAWQALAAFTSPMVRLASMHATAVRVVERQLERFNGGGHG